MGNRRLILEILTTVVLTLLVAGCIACDNDVPPAEVEKAGIESVSTGPGVFRSDEFYLKVDLPTSWAAAEGPEYLAHPFEGQVAFNSWEEEGFWAREVRTGSSSIYGPQTVKSQIPEGGAYVALVRIWGPPRPDDYDPTEYNLDDLSELCQPHDWRQDSATDAQFIQFYKWGRDLRLEIACHPAASDETVDELNNLLASWRFDAVPAGDVEWAGIQARQILPEEVEPLKFSNRAGSRGDNGIERMTEMEIRGDTVRFRFMYRWDVPPPPRTIGDECPDDCCHWWEIDVLPTGEAVLVDEGGAKLPFE